MDGANFNALVGLVASRAISVPDVCHLNLHKTFCIPHGGGGPGVGPIGVREHLKAFLPGHSTAKGTGLRDGVSAVASAPFGSASILPISWAYIIDDGTRRIEACDRSGNLKRELHRETSRSLITQFLYRGQNGRVAHECIIDVRPLKSDDRASRSKTLRNV